MRKKYIFLIRWAWKRSLRDDKLWILAVLISRIIYPILESVVVAALIFGKSYRFEAISLAWLCYDFESRKCIWASRFDSESSFGSIVEYKKIRISDRHIFELTSCFSDEKVRDRTSMIIEIIKTFCHICSWNAVIHFWSIRIKTFLTSKSHSADLSSIYHSTSCETHILWSTHRDDAPGDIRRYVFYFESCSLRNSRERRRIFRDCGSYEICISTYE